MIDRSIVWCAPPPGKKKDFDGDALELGPV
jgi:hypothetical protein